MADKRSGKAKLTLFSSSLQREIAGLFLVSMGGVSFLALISLTRGALSDLAASILRQTFGWGSYLVALMLLAAGVLLLWRNLDINLQMPWQRIIGAEALFVVALSISHLIAGPTREGLSLAQSGRGGGYVGWTVSYFLVEALGIVPAQVILGLVGLVGLVWTLQWSGTGVRDMWGQLLARLAIVRQRFWERRQVETPVAPSASRPRPRRMPATTRYPASLEPSQFEIEVDKSRPGSAGRRRKSLPPLDLLEEGTWQQYDEAELQQRAQRIEETLYDFGVPAKVVECRPGPAVTQFGVEPGYIERRDMNGETQQWKVRVNKITALANDLALALAAAPIRIEAPVPGRAVVGIEVPNTRISVVTLRSVVETREFAGLKAPLKIALGRSVAGSPVIIDLARMPHLLIAGATGSGKSVCINSLLSCLLLNHTPETLRLILIDPKRVELFHFNGIPHLLGPVISEVDQVVAALKWTTREMDHRYHLFARVGARNLAAFNRRAQAAGGMRLPFLMICVDELAELMMASPDEVERLVCRIAQMARATGIHLVISTQRPSVDVVTGLIKANFPARICFAVTSQVDSRVVLDVPGAERLLGRGDMLLMTPDSSNLVRVQGCFVSDAEIERLARFWQDKATGYLSLLDETAPWEEEAAVEEDELLEAAKELVRQHQQASVSFLQRRLRIGYPRAARLMDILEERGIVGPQVNGGRSRDVLFHAEEDDE